MSDMIEKRRSIRKYRPATVPKHMIQQVIQAGILAPSSKNRQPWKFTVVYGAAKTDMLAQMSLGLSREAADPMLPNSRKHLDGAIHTLHIMEQAPVIIFITNSLGLDLSKPLSAEDRIYEICNAQSIGAAIQNMTLAATGLGLGSLWICDIFFAYEELSNWLCTDKNGQLYAALALGYADEAPDARSGNPMDEITEWRET